MITLEEMVALDMALLGYNINDLLDVQAYWEVRLQ